MKRKKSLLTLFSLVLLMIFGCQEEQGNGFVKYEGDGKLKRVLLYASVDSKNPINILDEYEYDNQNRISKVSSPKYENGNIVGTIKYDSYEYNTEGQLTKISNFNANASSPSGFINLKNFSYTYFSNGLREKELIEYPQINSHEYSLYFYSDEKLIKMERYNNKEELADYTTYDYDQGGRLVKEIVHAPDDNIISTTNHLYTNGLNSKSEIYSGGTGDKIREIKKTYDSNYNLIAIESNELMPYSSMMSHVLRYEYY